MKMLDFLDRITQKNIVPLTNSSSVTIHDFYRDTIEINLPAVQVVQDWHQILMRFVDEPDAKFFIRKFGGASQKQWNLLRRGFLTEYNNAAFIYCDNFLAHYFYNMAIEGYVPEYDDFRDTILQMKFPYGHMETKEELEHRASPRGKSPKINSNGWKLAHIYSVNQNDYSYDYKTAEHKLFTIGEHKDWIKGKKWTSRVNPVELSAHEQNTIKTHFLRFVHPINYFTVPKAKHHQSAVGNNIGEHPDLLDFMKGIQLSRFGEVYLEYKQSIAALDKTVGAQPGETVINITLNKMAAKPADKTKKTKSQQKGKDTNTKAAQPTMKVGELVKTSFVALIENKLIADTDIKNLSDKTFSKVNFDINYPFLIKVVAGKSIAELRTVKDRPRYWKDVFTINGIEYLLCKEWYEGSRNLFMKWQKKKQI